MKSCQFKEYFPELEHYMEILYLMTILVFLPFPNEDAIEDSTVVKWVSIEK